MTEHIRAPRNRTITLSSDDIVRLRPRLLSEASVRGGDDIIDGTIQGNSLMLLPILPPGIIDLLIVDPPYNLTKSFNGSKFRERSPAKYGAWLRSWLESTIPLLQPTASIYVCSEWRTSGEMQRILEDFFIVRNRITWEREKGRGASHNWKNCSEDIWFCTLSNDYYFDVEAVKQKRKVIAPYRDESGKPKDWEEEANGGFRLTHPSNLWTDITVPFWSMPENTDHPTQKPEKLIAKLILASSKPGNTILDPFLGSGTTSVVAKKLGRAYIGIELEEDYCLLAERRLELANVDPSIQGYSGSYFWERNTLAHQQRENSSPSRASIGQSPLFEAEF